MWGGGLWVKGWWGGVCRCHSIDRLPNIGCFIHYIYTYLTTNKISHTEVYFTLLTPNEAYIFGVIDMYGKCQIPQILPSHSNYFQLMGMTSYDCASHISHLFRLNPTCVSNTWRLRSNQLWPFCEVILCIHNQRLSVFYCSLILCIQNVAMYIYFSSYAIVMTLKNLRLQDQRLKLQCNVTMEVFKASYCNQWFGQKFAGHFVLKIFQNIQTLRWQFRLSFECWKGGATHPCFPPLPPPNNTQPLPSETSSNKKVLLRDCKRRTAPRLPPPASGVKIKFYGQNFQWFFDGVEGGVGTPYVRVLPPPPPHQIWHQTGTPHWTWHKIGTPHPTRLGIRQVTPPPPR